METSQGAWSEEEDALLVQLWSDGLSAHQISDVLPTKTRNAVIGRARRIELPRRHNSPGAPKPVKVVKPLGRPKGVKSVKSAAVIVRGPKLNPDPFVPRQETIPRNGGLVIMQLRGFHCRWVLGEVQGIDTLYCGKRISERSYCSYHADMAYHGRLNHAATREKEPILRPGRLVTTGQSAPRAA